jgi:hypothetical protein
MQIEDAERASRNWRRKQRLARLRLLRNSLMLALMCIPLLIAMVIFSQVFTTTGLERQGSLLALVIVISLFDIPVIILLSSALLIVERFIVQEAAEAWQQFASQTNLTHTSRTLSFFSRNLITWGVGQVSGIYREHQVSVYTKRITPYQRATCMALELKRAFKGDLTLTYMHYPDPYALIEAKPTTFEQAFEVQQQPAHFGDRVIASPSLRSRLLRMHQGTTLRIHKTRIELQQQARPGVYGIEQDAAYMHFLLDLLSDLTEAMGASPLPGSCVVPPQNAGTHGLHNG